MAFPVDAGRAATNGSTAAVNKICNLPAGIQSGDLLVLILNTVAADTHSTPTGWTALALNNGDPASDDTTSIWYRVANGSEGSSVTVSCTTSDKFAAICWRITGAATPELSTMATGADDAPDPPSLTPSGGTKDYLWLWLGAWEGEQQPPLPTGNPTNYSNPVGAHTGTVGFTDTNARVAGASRQINAASEDPPSWTISSANNWRAWTLAVPPGGSSTVQASASLTASASLSAAARSKVTAAASLTATATLQASAISKVTAAAALAATATINANAIVTTIVKAAASLVATATMQASAEAYGRASAVLQGTATVAASAEAYGRAAAVLAATAIIAASAEGYGRASAVLQGTAQIVANALSVWRNPSGPPGTGRATGTLPAGSATVTSQLKPGTARVTRPLRPGTARPIWKQEDGP